jgi:hypothetical protein
MTRIPELTVTHDGATGFVSAKCGLCDEEMPMEEKRSATSLDEIRWFAAQFDFHMKEKHLAEYTIPGRLEV